MLNFIFSPDKRIDNNNANVRVMTLLFFLLLLLGLWTLNITASIIEDRRADLKAGFFITRQVCYILLGLIACFACAEVDFKMIKHFLPILLIVTFACCVFVILPGIRQNRNGAYRWLYMGFIKLQPSELAKFTLVLYLANFFDKRNSIATENDDISTAGAWAVLLVFTALIYLQNDLSTTFFIFLMGAILIFVCGEKKRLFIIALCVTIPFLILFIFSKSYRLNRTIAFLAHFRNPDFLKDSVNYQPSKSIDAICNGGIVGQGIGTGMSASYSVPELHTDYIFCGFAEACGLVGVALFFLLLFAISFTAYRISIKCKDRFASYAAFGFTTMIVCQSLLNIGVACAALPSTGITLPLFSFGGSSIIVTMMMFGIIINAAKYSDNVREQYKAGDTINVGDIYE